MQDQMGTTTANGRTMETRAMAVNGTDGTNTGEMYVHLVAAGTAAEVSVQGQPQGEDQQQAMNTGMNLARNLDGSPSWNSAMTPMLTQQLDHLYHYQAQRQQQHPQSLSHSAQEQGHPGLPHRPASSLARSSSFSTIGGPHLGHPSSPLESEPVVGTGLGGNATQYSLDLRRQQEDQLRRIQQSQRGHQHNQHTTVSAAEVGSHYHPHLHRHPFMDEEDPYLLHMNATGAVGEVYRLAEEAITSTTVQVGTSMSPTEHRNLTAGELQAPPGLTNSGHPSPLVPPHHHPVRHHPYYPHPQYEDGAHSLAGSELDIDGYGHTLHHPPHLGEIEMYQHPLVDNGVSHLAHHPPQLDLEGSDEMIKFEPGLE
jgi:hypothetical protein